MKPKFLESGSGWTEMSRRIGVVSVDEWWWWLSDPRRRRAAIDAWPDWMSMRKMRASKKDQDDQG